MSQHLRRLRRRHRRFKKLMGHHHEMKLNYANGTEVTFYNCSIWRRWNGQVSVTARRLKVFKPWETLQ